MAGITTTPESDGGSGVIYLDNSGGYIQLLVSSGGYTMHHKFHVAPFNLSEGGAYNTVGTSQEANVLQTADSLVVLIARMYPSTSHVAAAGCYQTTDGGKAVVPTALDLSTATSPGTSSTGTTLGLDSLLGITGHGVDFSRWQIHLHDSPALSAIGFQRALVATLGAGNPIYDFMEYLVSAEAGPGLGGVGTALFTQVVTHSGEPLAAPMYVIGSLSRRMRRRYGWL